MKTLVLGGVKSGKSRFAESLAKDTHLQVTYMATATAGDDEMRQRIEHHQASRPAQWNLVEEPLSLGAQINSLHGTQHCILIDCLTLWLSNCLIHDDQTRFHQERETLLQSVDDYPDPLVMVSNETNLGITPMGALSRRFCDEAGLLHQALAGKCDTVVVTMAGLPLYLKGGASAPNR